jgi:hypothetical protein
MSIRWFKNNIEALAVLGLLLSLFMAVPPCFAGGAVTIVVDKHQLAPRGSYIPARRVQEVLKKIEERQALVKKKALQQEEQQQKDASPKP